MMDDIECKQIGNFYNMENCFWRNETEYRTFHNMKILGYLNLACCLIIIISNAFIILVLLKKSMTSSVNTIFTHIAITESIATISYAPRAWHEFFRAEECAIPEHRTFFWETVSLGFYKFALIFRSIGVWLAVMLAVWRYIAVIHPLMERRWCNPELTSKFIKLGYVFGVIVTIPVCFAVQVGSAYKLFDKNGCLTLNYAIGNRTLIYELQLPLENYPVLYFIVASFYATLKLLPSVAFTFISYRMINRLIQVKKQRKSMICQHPDRQRDRTTIVLVVILVLFAIGQIPHGILCVLAAYHGPSFSWRYHFYGTEINSSLTLISESFNFIIYYAMSQQFRNAFKELFLCKTIKSRRIRGISQDHTSCSKFINKSNKDSNKASGITTDELRVETSYHM